MGHGVDLLVLHANNIFDGKNDQLLNNFVIIIKEEKIIKIGPEKEIDIPEHATHVNCSNCTLMPGMVDSHTHLSISAEIDDFLHKISDPTFEVIVRAFNNLQKDLLAGITTIRIPGEKKDIDTICKLAVERNPDLGPRIKSANIGVRAINGHGYIGMPAENISDIRKIFKKNIENGADFLKFFLTGNVPTNHYMPYYYSEKKIKDIIDTAHSLGKAISVHATGGKGLKLALDAGVDIIEHGYFIEENMLDQMIDKNQWLVATNTFMFNDIVNQNIKDITFRNALKSLRNQVKKNFNKVYSSEINVVLGTDGLHGGVALEAILATEMGMPVAKALKAMTIQAAKMLQMDDKIGSLEVNKEADIIGIHGNPFIDINSLKYVVLVIKKGKIIRNQLKM